jgi:hypothetical protein
MKTKEETLKKVISESDYFISEDHWVWTIAIKAMEEYHAQFESQPEQPREQEIDYVKVRDITLSE